MTIEEFSHKCMNARDKTVFKVYSYNYLLFADWYDKMPTVIKNLHVSRFKCEYDNTITINVQEMRR